MDITNGQKIKLLFVNAVVKAVWFVDLVGAIPEKAFGYAVRTGVYFFIIGFILTGVVLDSSGFGLYEFPGMLNLPIVGQGVLGASEKKADYPALVEDLGFPAVSAESVFAVDVDTDRVLVDINGEKKLPPASTTKLATALVALDLYKLDEYLSVPEFCTVVESQRTGFYPGEEVKVMDLMYALLVYSGGDAACTLANGRGDGNKFVSLMNDKAHVLGMNDTHFTNSVGLDSNNGDHVSTASDLYLLAKSARKSDFLKEIFKTKEFTLSDGQEFTKTVRNTNDLLWTIPGTIGIKTGRTYAAGEVLIYEYYLEDKDVIIVVMGSDDRFSDTANVLDWVLGSYSWKD